MRFPAKKNGGGPKAPRDFPPRKDGILHLPPFGFSWDSPPLPKYLTSIVYQICLAMVLPGALRLRAPL